MAIDFTPVRQDPRVQLALVSEDKNTLVVRIWPDGTYVIREEIKDGEYDWKSDDYQDLDLYDYDALARFHDRRLLDEITTEIMG